MPAEDLFKTPITITPRVKTGDDGEPLTDEEGQPIQADGDPVETLCAVQPVGSDEVIAGVDAVQIDAHIWLPTGTPINYDARVEVPGHAYEVVGQPKDWSSPDGTYGHVEALVREVT